MEKIKILMVLGTTRREGVQAFLLNLLTNIDRDKYQVDLAVNLDIKDGGISDEVRQMGSEIYFWPYFKVYNYAQFVRFWRDFLSKHHFDIVHGHSTNSAAVYLKVAKEMGCATIAHSHSAGYRGNINANSATVPVTVPAAVSSVYNASRFTGGSDEESDNNLRDRVLKTYTAVPNGVNADYYKNLVLTVEGVEKAGVIERIDGYGTAGVYVCGLREQVSNAVVSRVNALLSQNDCVGAMVTAYPAVLRSVDLDVVVTRKPGYSAQDVRVAIENAFADYVYSIPMGERFYLSALGKYLLDTGCIENYVYDSSMTDLGATAATCFMPGNVVLGVSE